MSELTNHQKKEWARILYIKENLTQKEIAEKVGISTKTMSKWVNDNDWDKLKASYTISKEETLQRFYAQVNAIQNAIEAREEGERFAKGSEADVLVKVSAAIRNLETETSVADTIDVFTKFLDWLKMVDLKKAQEFVEIQDKYIKTLLK